MNKEEEFKEDLLRMLTSLEDAIKCSAYLTSHSIQVCKFVEKWKPLPELPKDE